MAYTRVWDNAAPPNGRDADEIGAAIREFRVDIDQRLLTAFTNIDLDPLVPVPAISGAVTARPLMISPFASTWRVPSQITITPGVGYIRVATDGFTANTGEVAVIVPVGYTITEIDARYTATTGDTITWSLRYVETSTGVVTNLSGDLANVGTNAIQTIVSGALAKVVLNTEAYFIQFEIPATTAAVNLMGFRIKITKTDNSTGY